MKKISLFFVAFLLVSFTAFYGCKQKAETTEETLEEVEEAVEETVEEAVEEVMEEDTTATETLPEETE